MKTFVKIKEKSFIQQSAADSKMLECFCQQKFLFRRPCFSAFGNFFQYVWIFSVFSVSLLKGDSSLALFVQPLPNVNEITRRFAKVDLTAYRSQIVRFWSPIWRLCADSSERGLQKIATIFRQKKLGKSTTERFLKTLPLRFLFETVFVGFIIDEQFWFPKNCAIKLWTAHWTFAWKIRIQYFSWIPRTFAPYQLWKEAGFGSSISSGSGIEQKCEEFNRRLIHFLGVGNSTFKRNFDAPWSLLFFSSAVTRREKLHTVSNQNLLSCH